MTAAARPAANQDEIDQALALRLSVFAEEQRVPVEEELDRFDAEALHLVVVDRGKVVATCRLVVDRERAKLGRMAVEQQSRRQGIAAAMLREADDQAARLGAKQITLAAQCYVAALYEQADYQPYGEPFDDAGIEHIWLTSSPHLKAGDSYGSRFTARTCFAEGSSRCHDQSGRNTAYPTNLTDSAALASRFLPTAKAGGFLGAFDEQAAACAGR